MKRQGGEGKGRNSVGQRKKVRQSFGQPSGEFWDKHCPSVIPLWTEMLSLYDFASLTQRMWAALGSSWPWLRLFSAPDSDPEGINGWRLFLTSPSSPGQQVEEGSESNISMSMTHVEKLEHIQKRVTRIVVMSNINETVLYMESVMSIPEKGKN